MTAALGDPRRNRATELIGEYVDDGAEPAALFIGLFQPRGAAARRPADATGLDQAELLQDLAARAAASRHEED